jgi:transcription antitermination factor NusG
MEGDVFRRAINQRGLFVRPGDRVRIIVGPLANWLATVVRLTNRHRCVLSIDGLSDGVFVILPADDLERM